MHTLIATLFAVATLHAVDLHSPISRSLVISQLLHEGRIAIRPSSRPPLAERLTCTPRPCTLPNVQASEGGKVVNETPIASNPNRINQLLTGGNDFNCSSGLGFDASHDGGSTWNHICFG